MHTRLNQLSVGNVIFWQDSLHRVCNRTGIDHRMQLELCPESILEGSEKRVFPDNQVFRTRPISSALAVPLMRRNSKLEKVRTWD